MREENQVLSSKKLACTALKSNNASANVTTTARSYALLLKGKFKVWMYA